MERKHSRNAAHVHGWDDYERQVRAVLVGVRCVTVVHIGHDEILVVVLKSVAIFDVIFCIWRRTLHTLTSTKLELYPRLYRCPFGLP